MYRAAANRDSPLVVLAVQRFYPYSYLSKRPKGTENVSAL